MRFAMLHPRSARSSAPLPTPGAETASRISSSLYLGARSLVGREIAFRIGQDHVPHRLVMFDVAGTAAQMAVERVGDGFFQFRTLDRCLRQTFQQHLGLVQEA